MSDHLTIQNTKTRQAHRSLVRFWKIARLIVAVVGLVGIVVGSICRRYYSPESCYLRGREALLAGDDAAVVRESDRLILSNGFKSQGHLIQGILLARSGKPSEALAHLEKASVGVTAVEANTAAAKCYYQIGRYVEAVITARKALDLDRSAIDARRWMASAYYDLGAMADASVELEEISKQAPDDSRPERLLGLIAKDSERYPSAVAHYRESLRRDPWQPGRSKLLGELAESQIKSDSFDDALTTLTECPRTAASLTMESECYQALGQAAEAQERLREAIALDPRYYPAKMALGTILLDLGQVDRAKELLTEAIRLRPKVSRTHFQLSQAFRMQGKLNEAEEELRQMRDIQATEKEFSELHESSAKFLSDADIRYRLGELARQLDKPDLATMWFRAAIAINPNHSLARAALSESELRSQP